MIYLYTGVPGTYKTYSAIKDVIDMAKAGGGRPVFQHGVAGCAVPGWNTASLQDVENWQTVLPEGSILVVDEIASIVPSRVKGDPPAWIDALRTHRHKGLDLIFITQHPMDCDVVFRRLVGAHFHFYRQFGIRRATFLRTDGVDDNPDPGKPKPGQVVESRAIDPSVFQLYKSTVLDTHGFKVPRKLLLAGLFFVAAGALSWFLLHDFEAGSGELAAMAENTPGPQLEQVDARPVQRSTQLTAAFDKWGTVPQCILAVERGACRCYTDQGTRMPEVSTAECRLIVEYGVYDPRRASDGRQSL